MLNEERIRLMTRLASYEEKEGEEDFKISAYYRKDYVSIHALQTFLWITLGYVLVIGVLGVSYMDALMKHLEMRFALICGGAVIICYIIVLIIYLAISHNYYQKKHNQARKRVKRYNRDLIYLNQLYKKENL